MITRKVKVAFKNGLHARPAAIFVRMVEESGQEVTINYGGENADASSLLEIMALGVEHGAEVELSCLDDKAEEFLEQLVELLSTEME